MTMPLKVILNELQGRKITGVIHYGDVSDPEIADYEFNAVGKVVWIHPDPQKNMMLYPRISGTHFRSNFSSVQILDEDTSYSKRFDTYVRENIAFLNLDKFTLLKINKTTVLPTNSYKFLVGAGNLIDQHPSIKTILVAEDTKEVTTFLAEKKFKKLLTMQDTTLYIREE